MGEVIEKLTVKSSDRGKAVTLPLCFDSGSRRTFVRQDVAKRLGNEMELPEPRVFHGLGNGEFAARTLIHLLIRIKGIWCFWPSYVIPTEALHVPILVGHDLIQEFNIRLDTRRRKIIADKEDLNHARYVL